MDAAALAADVHAVLLARGETISCAESLTGGGLAHLLSGTPGASATFVGGVVSYATRVKRSLLGVETTNVVSANAAAEMATGVRTLMGSDWAVATTGVAGPTPQGDQPVGTVFVAVLGPSGLDVHRFLLSGDRQEVRAATTMKALEEVLHELG